MTTGEAQAKDLMMIDYLTNRQIQWKFIPKRAPWYVGFWERLVGLNKSKTKNDWTT